MKLACKTAALLLCMTPLVGCQSQSLKPGPIQDKQQPLVESDPAMLQLVSIAQNVHARTAINDQILAKRYGIQDEPRMPIQKLPADLKRIISFPGGQQLELHAAIKYLAQIGGVSYIHPQGKKPLTGIYVGFDDQLRTVAEYIADAARQAGFRADVVLDLSADPSPSVQIIYKGAVL